MKVPRLVEISPTANSTLPIVLLCWKLSHVVRDKAELLGSFFQEQGSAQGAACGGFECAKDRTGTVMPEVQTWEKHPERESGQRENRHSLSLEAEAGHGAEADPALLLP